MNTYFFGVYKDYSENRKIGQLADTIDSLSCEILAKPGVVRIESSTIRTAWKHAKKIAIDYSCTHIEQLCNAYKFIKLK